ncbi:MAG: PKD domain-containing protein [Candidatus Bipolaricaulota bacterium]|nr:PKD domain-containing protein [Candidatus Bipolaricaulota bacterium]
MRVLLLAGLCVGGLILTGCDWFAPQSKVDFTFTPSSGDEPLAVDFAPVLEGAAAGCAWNFGDGATSTENSPSHIYYAAGTYSVTLAVVFGDGESCSATKPDCIVVGEGPMFEKEDGLYWLDRTHGAIVRGSRSGGGAQESVVSGIADAGAIAVGGSYVFWTSGNNVLRAPLSRPTGWEQIASGSYTVTDVAVDTSKSKVYWTVLPTPPLGLPAYKGGIYRADLDGSNSVVYQSYERGSEYVAWELAVDPFAGAVYWLHSLRSYVSARGAEGAWARDWSSEIRGSTYLGTPVTTIFPVTEATELAASTGLAHIAQYLYWTDSLTGMIWVTSIDGSNWELMRGLSHPTGIAADASANALFWCDDGGIHRANLDGTNARVLYENVYADTICLGP